MNNLRRIMQKLAEGSTSKRESASPSPDESTKTLSLVVQNYATRLESCSEAMLQYEWAWLEEHIEDLKLSLCHPEMLKNLGGKNYVERLLVESKGCKHQLEKRMNLRKVQPASQIHTTVSGEHAWDVKQEQIRKAWGF
jgi:hypothetical protein